MNITPFLWFDGGVAEAVTYCTELFDDSVALSTTEYPEGAPGSAGEMMSATFRLAGQDFIALNGGPQYSFTPAVSFLVNCETQEDVDRLWDALTDGGEPGQCGWLVDRFGLSWQVVPTRLGELLSSSNAAGAQRAMQAMLGMGKLDVSGLQRAFDGE